MLLEHAGQVVSREELQKALWPADTFVDFDHGLNKAINKIREALGDSAESPRFVETVARRGYRFIADVKVADCAVCECRGRTGASPGGARWQSRRQAGRARDAAIQGEITRVGDRCARADRAARVRRGLEALFGQP